MNDACYCSSDGKIYGVSGPYVIQCNGTTGRREGYVRVASPLMGDMRICYHAATDSMYVSAIWQPNMQEANYLFPPVGTPFLSRNIFPVSTAMVVGTRIDMDAIYENSPPYGGFQWIGSNGIYLYVVRPVSGNTGTTSRYGFCRFDPTNLADIGTNSSNRFRPEQCAFSPTQVAQPTPNLAANNSQLRISNLAVSSDNEVYLLPNNPCAVEYCGSNGLFYVVCGTDSLLRVDTITPFPGTFTALNLGAVEATADPCRIRYWSGTGKLYLPCMTANGIIVWNPNTDNPIDAEFKSGFDNPIDIVATGSKIFAVQNAQIGLREIT
jgi:hypothetical protein